MSPTVILQMSTSIFVFLSFLFAIFLLGVESDNKKGNLSQLHLQPEYRAEMEENTEENEMSQQIERLPAHMHAEKPDNSNALEMLQRIKEATGIEP